MVRKVTVSAEIHDFVLNALAVRVIAGYACFAAVPHYRIVALGRAGVFALCRWKGVGKARKVGSLTRCAEKCGGNPRIVLFQKCDLSR